MDSPKPVQLYNGHTGSLQELAISLYESMSLQEQSQLQEHEPLARASTSKWMAALCCAWQQEELMPPSHALLERTSLCHALAMLPSGQHPSML